MISSLVMHIPALKYRIFFAAIHLGIHRIPNIRKLKFIRFGLNIFPLSVPSVAPARAENALLDKNRLRFIIKKKAGIPGKKEIPWSA